jgi:hypothetical protein
MSGDTPGIEKDAVTHPNADSDPLSVTGDRP